MIFVATPDDAATIIAVAEKSWDATYRDILSAEQYHYMQEKFYGLPVIRQAIESGEQVFLLNRAGGQVTGFVSYQLNYPVAACCKIHKLYLLPEAQGTGTGRKLLEAVEQAAISQGCNRLTLNVNKYNKALGFYQKTGFVIDYPEVIDIGEGFVMDDFALVKNLTPPS